MSSPSPTTPDTGPGPGWSQVPTTAAASVRRGGPVRRTARSQVTRVLLILLLVVVLAACGLLTLLIISSQTGVTGLVTGFVVALVPVLIVVPALLWLDRFEAEPTSLLLFAFAWGALVATFVALLVNSYSLVLLQDAGGDISSTAVLVAPWVEETAKGSAVLLVLLVRRREFDGVVDGIVYAGLAGVGFAFTENVLYLGRALEEGGTGGLVVTFVLRGLFGPFAHPMFTMAIGIGLGVAAVTRRRWLRVVAPLLGWLSAVGLHALWNLSAVAGLRGFITLYVLVQVPIFLAAVAFALWARRRESRLIGRHLSVYAASGWFTPAEVQMLTSMSGRRAARGWAGSVAGGGGRHAMAAFQAAATELAFARDRMSRGTAAPDARDVERALLHEVACDRYGFVPARARR
jgi:RsiW-degrading membrane proteinase PrsW (M82 family)